MADRTGAGIRRLPLPPLEMRILIGPTDESAFDNPTGDPIYSYIPVDAYDSFFDFGCGCGRVARQLMQQSTPPKRYVGIDLHRGMVYWCQLNLQPRRLWFTFLHHDVFNAGLNPLATSAVLPFPVEDKSFRLVTAHSVFTHLAQSSAEFYIREVARILHPEGYVNLTVFLFDKRPFPFMQPSQNALYIHPDDPNYAVIFDRDWFMELIEAVGLKLTIAQAPGMRGYHWVLVLRPRDTADPAIALPADNADFGVERPSASAAACGAAVGPLAEIGLSRRDLWSHRAQHLVRRSTRACEERLLRVVRRAARIGGVNIDRCRSMSAAIANRRGLSVK